jgi:hypothetical protein
MISDPTAKHMHPGIAGSLLYTLLGWETRRRPNNPVEAGFVSGPQHWKWSSAHDYCGGTQGLVEAIGKVITLADGAKIYLHEFEAGRFNVGVEGDKGIITTMSNWSQKSIIRISKNYGWDLK